MSYLEKPPSQELIFGDMRSKTLETFTGTHLERRQDPFGLIHVEGAYLQGVFKNLVKQSHKQSSHLECLTAAPTLKNMDLDDYDTKADIYLLSYKPLDLIIAGLRLIFPDASKPHYGLKTLQEHPDIEQHIGKEAISKTVELSKLVICDERFKVCMDHLKTTKSHDTEQRHPPALLHLYKPLYTAYATHGMLFATTLLDEKTLQQFNFLGVDFHKSSSMRPNEPQNAYYLNLSSDFKNLKLTNPKMYEFISNNYNL